MRKLAVVVFVLGLPACAQQTPAPLTGDALVARGQYLVNNIGGCNDCHTTMTPQGPDMSRALQGATLIFAPTIEMPWAPVAPSIAGLPAGYTDKRYSSRFCRLACVRTVHMRAR